MADKQWVAPAQHRAQMQREKELSKTQDEQERKKIIERYSREAKGVPKELEGLRLGHKKNKGKLKNKAKSKYGI